MTEDVQEYLQEWEKINNPFYPNEMRWDRVKVNNFLKSYKEQLRIGSVSNRRELLSNLDEAIKKAKPNMDKIKDVDKHIDSIR